MNKKLEILEKLKFFSQLNESQKSFLIENSRFVKYDRAQNVYSAHNECLGVMIVTYGELRAYLISEEGREITLYRLGQNNICILSASCLLKKITFDVFIDANIDSEVLLINASAFEKIQSENIYAENFALSVAVEKFSDVMWQMEQMLFYPIDKRIAFFLMDEVNKSNSRMIKLTHEQIAKYIGSAREVVSRTLKRFEKLSLVSISNGIVEVKNIEGLKNITE